MIVSRMSADTMSLKKYLEFITALISLGLIKLSSFSGLKVYDACH